MTKLPLIKIRRQNMIPIKSSFRYKEDYTSSTGFWKPEKFLWFIHRMIKIQEVPYSRILSNEFNMKIKPSKTRQETLTKTSLIPEELYTKLVNFSQGK